MELLAARKLLALARRSCPERNLRIQRPAGPPFPVELLSAPPSSIPLDTSVDR